MLDQGPATTPRKKHSSFKILKNADIRSSPGASSSEQTTSTAPEQKT